MGQTPYPGFPAGKQRFTRIPSLFFKELLPQIDDLAELKVTLYALWQLDRMEGDQRYLQVEDFTGDEIFMAWMAGTDGERLATLEGGLEAAVARGSLLKAEVDVSGSSRALYFLNSERGRRQAEAVEKGEWQPSGDERYPISLMQERPNIFQLYERHIGALTPMLADTLKEAEDSYPLEWIEEAIRIAVENNARKWAYVEAILRRWQEEGRHEGRTQGNTEKDRRKYVEGEFSDFIEH